MTSSISLKKETNYKKENFLSNPMSGKNTVKKYFKDEELYEALFKHMKESSSPGPDGFTVNWLRHFWPEMKDLTREALN